MSRIELPQKVGKYEIRGLVGKGAMGVVYRAVDPDLSRPVAIKTMSVGSSPHEAEMRLRFLREGRSAGMLQHPNIITVHELFEEAGTAYLVMELLEGASLSSLIRRRKNLSIGEKLSILDQIASGLAEAHANGIVHRDLKPSNVFVLRSGVAKVLDFGVAKMGEGELTRAGTVFGTVEYMAPEQVRGGKVAAGADIFSWGVVAYELLSGANPFRADTLAASVFKIVSDTPEPLAHVPVDISACIFRALEKSERKRYQSMTELREAMANAAAAASVRSSPPALLDSDMVVTKDRGDASVTHEPRVSQWSHVAAQADLLEELYHQGVAAFQDAKYAGCIEKMSQVLDEVPVHAMALHYLAMSEENVRKTRLADDARSKLGVLLKSMRDAHRVGDSNLVMEKAKAVLAADKESMEARWYRRHAEARLRATSVGGPPRSFGYRPSAHRPPPGPIRKIPDPAPTRVTRPVSSNRGLWVLVGVGCLFLALVGLWLSAFNSTPPAASAAPGPKLPGVSTSPFDGIDEDGNVVLQLPKATAGEALIDRVIPMTVPAGGPTRIALFGSGLSDALDIRVADGAASILSTTIVSSELIEVELFVPAGVTGVNLVVTGPSGSERRFELGVDRFQPLEN
ncbi:MAG TPA: protein kinase [Vicinamibacteria bacterium]|nr:protein kinase [Vicinamibacteria bacterium]